MWFNVLNAGFRFLDFGFWVLGSGFWVLGFEFRGLGFEFRVLGHAFLWSILINSNSAKLDGAAHLQRLVRVCPVAVGRPARRGMRQLLRLSEGFAFKAHRLLYHSTLGSRVTKKKKKGFAFRKRPTTVMLWVCACNGTFALENHPSRHDTGTDSGQDMTREQIQFPDGGTLPARTFRLKSTPATTFYLKSTGRSSALSCQGDGSATWDST